MPVKLKLFIVSLIIQFLVSSAFADAKNFYSNRAQFSSISGQQNKTITESWLPQFISHKANNNLTFKQRYFYDTQFSRHPNDPIFLYICGEATCKKSSLEGAIKEYAKRFHAKLISLEHRYYGKSIPTKNLSS